jgi:hypothetical protein
MSATKNNQHAYIITVNMGYGHQRAAYPLKDIAACPPEWDHGEPTIIAANTYPGIPKKDMASWEGSRKVYETISRFKKVPIIGKAAFDMMDYVQRIEPFYPERDLSAPTLQVKQIYKMIHKKQWGKHLIDSLNRDPKPYITTFFITAFFAEEHGYKGDIYCLCTDTDISRAWAPLHPETSRIKYFAPTKRVKERLMCYGVRAENIYVTGFPLPKENIGARTTNHTLKQALGCRISNLDPKGIYQKKYEKILTEYLGTRYCTLAAKHPFTIMFAVGGAGAQREIGIEILKSLRSKIEAKEMRLILVAGSRQDVFRYYEDEINKLGLMHSFDDCLQIVYGETKQAYFEKFNAALSTTDVLWTKPSELSFYAGLGLPIIMTPGIGSQEQFNRRWLHSVGAGMEQLDPEHCAEWLEDWMESGGLAEAAMEGFLDAPRNGVYHIEDIVVRGKISEIEDMHLM